MGGVSVKLDFTPDTKRRLHRMPGDFKKSFWKGLQEAMYYAEKKSKRSMGTIGKPGVITGSLRRSIKSSVEQDVDGSVTGLLWSNLEYARIHEMGGGNVRPGFPARPYLRPAIEDNLNKIEKIILDRITEDMN